jgi:hypothetical protein
MFQDGFHGSFAGSTSSKTGVVESIRGNARNGADVIEVVLPENNSCVWRSFRRNSGLEPHPRPARRFEGFPLGGWQWKSIAAIKVNLHGARSFQKKLGSGLSADSTSVKSLEAASCVGRKM